MNPTTQQQIEDLTPGTVFGIADQATLPDNQQDMYVKLANGDLFWFVGDGGAAESTPEEDAGFGYVEISKMVYVSEGNDRDIRVIA